MKELLNTLGLDAIYGLDWETYWADDYTLSALPTTEYVMDPRFESQLVSVRRHDQKKSVVMEAKAFDRWASTQNWNRLGLLAHHCHFDGLIASHHHRVHPKFYFDTLSMGRALLPMRVGGSLDKMAKTLGFKGKTRHDALLSTKGRHWHEFTKLEQRNLKLYAGDDTDDMWGIFHKLLPFITTDELHMIDSTVRMYARPRVLFDASRLEQVLREAEDAKNQLLSDSGVQLTQLMSNDQFAELLEIHGVDPPMKISPATNEPTFAFAKTDLAFKKLLEHDDPIVARLVEARLGVKSTNLRTRGERMLKRAHYGPQPVYLNYWGANTGRWSGGDKMNWQNFSKKADLRKAIIAPKGHVLIISDLAQIEARLNAWFSGQQNVIDAFARGEDVYALAASLIYGRKITAKDNPTERFVGKVAVLMLGYGAGWSKFAMMLRLGTQGPALDISDDEAMTVHGNWRAANPFIVANWRATQNLMASAFLGKQRMEHGCVAYEGVGEHGFMELPDGTTLRYNHVEADVEGMRCTKRINRRKTMEAAPEYMRLWPGLCVENRTQALARCVIAEHMRGLRAHIPQAQIVMMSHDEIVSVVPKRSADKALRLTQQIMSAPPDWAKGLPLAVDAHISEVYDKK